MCWRQCGDKKVKATHPKRIAVEGSVFAHQRTGVGFYGTRLLEAIATRRRDIEIFVYMHSNPVDWETKMFPNIRIIPARKKWWVPDSFWRIFWLETVFIKEVKQKNFDCIWFPNGLMPLRRIDSHSVVAIHDFVFKNFPRTMKPTAYFYRALLQRKSLAGASFIHSNSDSTKKEAERLYGCLVQDVIRPAASIKQYQGEATAAVKKLTSSSGFYLIVGTNEPRKNLEAFFSAYLELFIEEGLCLGSPIYVVGSSGWKNKKTERLLRKLIHNGLVKKLGYVSNADLRYLYMRANALFFPSLYEGFGMPVLEAHSVGCPVICSDLDVFRETLGPYGRFHDNSKPGIKSMFRQLIAGDIPRCHSSYTIDLWSWETESMKLERLLSRDI